MEVHAHTHTSRKKWTHYFWEFLMLFLAVTLGFLVENQREHYIENQRCRQYAFALIEDLKKDDEAFRILVEKYKNAILRADTLKNMVKERTLSGIADGSLYYYCEKLHWVIMLTFHDATLQQLKHSGNLRYFPPELQYKISEYDRLSRELSTRQENEVYFSRAAREMMYEIFDAETLVEVRNLSDPGEIEKFKEAGSLLITRDTMRLKKLLNEMVFRQESWQFRLKEVVEPNHTAALELLETLKKKYRGG